MPVLVSARRRERRFGRVAGRAAAAVLACMLLGSVLTVSPARGQVTPTVTIASSQTNVVEGTSITFTLTRSQAGGALVVALAVSEDGDVVSGAPPTSAAFGAGARTASVTVATADDRVVEGPSTVTATLLADATPPAEYTLGAAAAASVRVDDNDRARWTVTLTGGALSEGTNASATLTAGIANGVVFAEPQTVTLRLSGDAELGVDYTATSRGWPLAKPYRLTLPAGAASVTARISAVDDAHDESSESIVINAAVAGAPIGATLGATIADNDQSARMALTGLTATGTGRAMYPAFDPAIRHYAVGCADGGAVTVAAAAAATYRLSIAGSQRSTGRSHTVTLTGVSDERVVAIDLADAEGRLDSYYVHCVPSDFPVLTVTGAKASWGGLTAFSVAATGGGSDSFLVVIDSHGVPRFIRRIPATVRNFRPQLGGRHMWTYGKWVGRINNFRGGTMNTGEVVALDEHLVVQRRVTTTSKLAHTNLHDFVVRPNGNFILMAYEPAQRDLSAFTNPNTSQPYSTTEGTEDSVIQEVTPAGTEAFLWNSYDHLAIKDCLRHFFPRDYAHINSLQAVDKLIIGSFRGCSQVAAIDTATGDIAWLLGRSNLTPAEWQSRGGTAPLRIIGDPYGEFCGQHSARMISPTNLVLFDNGAFCQTDPDTGTATRDSSQFSRAVEYRIDTADATATFQRHHSLHNTFTRFSHRFGNVAVTGNGNWLISWGDSERISLASQRRPDVSVTEVDPTTNAEVWSLTVRQTDDPNAQLNRPLAVAAHPVREDQLRTGQASARIAWIEPTQVSATSAVATVFRSATANRSATAHVRWRTLPNGTWGNAVTVNGTDVNLPRLTAAAGYEVQASLDSAFPDTATQTASFTTLAAGTPEAVSLSGTTPGDRTLTVTWTAGSSAGVTGYDVRFIRSDTPNKADAQWSLLTRAWQPGDGSLRRTLTGLANGVSYDVAVRAVSAAGDGAWSRARSATPVRARPVGPPISTGPSGPSPGNGDSEAEAESDTALSGTTVVMANGWRPADMSVASVLAARTPGAVVVYVTDEGLPPPTLTLLDELRPAEVVIVGGTTAVPSRVRAQIRAALPRSGVARIAGQDRVDTAARVARRTLGSPADAGAVTLVVANGWSPPDISVAAALAARTPAAAVVFTQHDALPAAAATLLRDYRVTQAILIGGTGAIDSAVADRIAAHAPAVPILRIAGADRADTAAQAARRVLGNPSTARRSITLVMANGRSPADTGIAATLAGSVADSAVVYVENSTLPAPTTALIADYQPTALIIVGGAQAVSSSVQASAAATAPQHATITRISGESRFDTAAHVARRLLASLSDTAP